jgi:hypothetical protein
MQTAIVGFTKALTDIPEKFLQYYRDDPNIALDQLSLLPVSGQISSPTVGGKNLVGFSLFSLRKGLNSPSGLGLYTKALAFEVYRAASYDCFRAISYYDSPALRIHGRFSSRMEIEQPVVPLHPRRDMAMLYKMKIDIDPFKLNDRAPELEPSFWMKAQDSDRKRYMQAGLVQGKRFFIAAPYCVVRDGDTFLPILEEPAAAKGT